MSISLEKVPLGSTGLVVSPLCIGTSSWGRPREGEDPQSSTERAAALARRVLGDEPEFGYLDSSNMYGDGLSEPAIGAELKRRGGLPAGHVVQTKLDRSPVDGDFSGDRMWRSLEESLERLGLDSLQILFLHDPEVIGFYAAMAPGGPVEALMKMKAQGLATHVGISGGPVAMLDSFVSTDQFDILITHNRFTLVDRSATTLLANARGRGMAINNAAPYGAGGLSGRAGSSARYGYRESPPQLREAIAAMEAACRAAGVPLRAAALQFSMRSRLIDSTVVGISSLDRLDEALADTRVDIPEELWATLDALAPAGFALDNS